MSRRGAALIGVLLIIVILFIMGGAFLARQAAAYRGAVASRQGMLAHSLAEAGLEDARVKLDKDRNFPPPADSLTQPTFTYSEDVRDDAGQFFGAYTVTVDTSTVKFSQAYIIVITSVGQFGPRGAPLAVRSLVAELDASPLDRTNPTVVNPTLWQFLRIDVLN